MSRDSKALEIKRSLDVSYTHALKLARSGRLPRLDEHPLAQFVPEPLEDWWVREVSQFARDFQQLLDQMRCAYPDWILDSIIATEALKRGWGGDIRTVYFAACYEHFRTD